MVEKIFCCCLRTIKDNDKNISNLELEVHDTTNTDQPSSNATLASSNQDLEGFGTNLTQSLEEFQGDMELLDDVTFFKAILG